MQTNTPDIGGRAVQTAVTASLVAMLAAMFYPLYVSHLPLVPLWTAKTAKQRAPLVRVGMTDAQVWSTLGLAGRGFRARVSGSGPPEAYPANYVLWPGYVVHARWNLKTRPATLVVFKFQDRLQRIDPQPESQQYDLPQT